MKRELKAGSSKVTLQVFLDILNLMKRELKVTKELINVLVRLYQNLMKRELKGLGCAQLCEW